MAHMLDYNEDGQARFAYLSQHGGKVWHGEGSPVEDGTKPNFQEWLIQANMDFEIKDAPVVADLDGNLSALLSMDLSEATPKQVKLAIEQAQLAASPVDSHKLIYRTNERIAGDFKHLSVMGKGYAFLQPAEAFEILEDIVKDGLLEVQTIGSMHGGTRTFFACKINQPDVEVIPGDMLEKYLMCLDSYDGTTALTYASVATLPVCNNTVNAALREVRGKAGRKAYARHTTGLKRKERIENLREQIGLASAQIDGYANWMRELSKHTISNEDRTAFFEKLVFGEEGAPVLIDDWTKQQQRAVGELEYLSTNGNGAQLKGRRGTANGAFQAVTEWTNHMKNHKGGITTDRGSYVLFGGGHKINQRAATLLSEQYNVQLAA